MIVLVGFMGAGKTTVGRLLAHRLGIEFLDSDEVIERRAGARVPEIFARGGEELFREMEREVVADLLATDDRVVALGGGALEDAGTAAALRDKRVVHLGVSYDEAMRRVGEIAARPMLARAEPLALFRSRLRVYERTASETVATDGRAPEEVAALIAAGAVSASRGRTPHRIRVPLEVAYDVIVGRGILGSAARCLPPLPDAERAVIVTHPALTDVARPPLHSLEEAGLEVGLSLVDEGESSKSLEVAARLYDELARARIHRGDLVVGLGGGVVCDLAGYVASTFLRGVAVAQAPTTLLAQVDAAIGGKTGVNLPQGKNLVGTIHQPAVVVCDVSVLKSLPEAELRSGMAEVVKYGLIADPSLLELVEQRADDVLAARPEVLEEVVARSAAIKASVVASDERERGERAHLNYGHTFAHAIERSSGYGRVRHGEAVSLGMMAAAHLARRLGRIDDDAVEAHRRALERLRLPTSARLHLDELERSWQHDKKYRRGVRFVLLRQVGKPEAGVAASRPDIEYAIERLAG